MATANNTLSPQRSNSRGFSSFITSEAVKNRINAVIGGKDGQRFISAIVSAVSTNPKLAECDQSSILNAALLGESLKLSPSPQLGYYYMVPYEDKKTGIKHAQFQLGYKGYIQLALRSGVYKKINVISLKEGELKAFDALNEEIDAIIIDDEEARENAPTIGYYVMLEYLNGFRKSMYWSKNKMLLHADKYSPAFKAKDYARFIAGQIPEKELWKFSSFWYKDFDSMACKTMLRQLISKWGSLSVDLERAFATDEAVIAENGDAMYVENAPETLDTFSSDIEPEKLNNAQPMTEQQAQDSFFDNAK